MNKHTTGLMDGVHFFLCRRKTHLSLSTWTTRPLPSSLPVQVTVDEDDAAAASAGAISATQPLRLAHVGHWCWANSSKFFNMDSKDSGCCTLLGDSGGSTLTARLRMDGEAGSERLIVLFPSSVSSLRSLVSKKNYSLVDIVTKLIEKLPVNTLEWLPEGVLGRSESCRRRWMIQAERLSHFEIIRLC